MRRRASGKVDAGGAGVTSCHQPRPATERPK